MKHKYLKGLVLAALLGLATPVDFGRFGSGSNK